MLNIVEYTIKKYHMLNINEHIIIGVSGGADSMALLNVLISLKAKYFLNITAVHINHGLRGKEADEDEKFVLDFCRKNDVNAESFHFDIKKESKRLMLTEEETGRIIRYKAFNDVLEKYNADKIAVAHNINDNAETVLMNLFRGSGVNGLAGINPVREKIIRPLINCSREEIEQYCIKENILYRTDSTNSKTIYTRNKIRLDLIPWIKENLNNNIINSLSRTSNIIDEENNFLNQMAFKGFEECCIYKEKVLINIEKFKDFDNVLKRRIIRIACLKFSRDLHDISYEHVNMILSLLYKQTGKIVNLPYGLKAKRQYNNLLIYNEEIPAESFEYTIKIDNPVYIKQLNKKFVVSNNKYNLNNGYTIIFDLNKIKGDLILRSRKPGDKIFLRGVKGNKKIKDLFIDLKIPKDERESIPLLALENDILWVMDLKTSDFYKANENTKDKLYLHIWEENTDERDN